MCLLFCPSGTKASSWRTLPKCAKSLQSCPTLRFHRLLPIRLLCPWDSQGKNTGMDCHFLLQGIFQTQGLNLSPFHLLALAGGSFTTSTTYRAWKKRLKNSCGNSRGSGLMMPFSILHFQLSCEPPLRIYLAPVYCSLLPTLCPRTYLWANQIPFIASGNAPVITALHSSV